MNDTPKRKEHLAVEPMDDGLFVADFANARLHTLNPTAAAIWEMCDGDHSIESIASLIAEHFQLSLGDVHRDVQRIVGELNREGLLESA